MAAKPLLYREDLHIPAIIYDPRIAHEARNQTRDELVVVPDFAPTVLELCDQPIPETMTGTSVAPLLRGEQPTAWRQQFFAENLFDHQNYPRCECLQTTAWKYIRYFKRSEKPEDEGKFIRGTTDAYSDTRLQTLTDSGATGNEQPIYEELYDLMKDPGEEQNLAAKPEHATIVQQLRQELLSEGQRALAGATTTATCATTSMWA